jgi:hypothetical protein
MYPILDATGWRSVIQPRPPGRLEKELLIDPAGDVYIFKWPEKPGEAWAEKLAGELGHLFDLEMAEVELAIRENPTTLQRRGTLSRHFRYRKGQEVTGRWEPGVDLLQEMLPGYDGMSQYSYQRVRAILEPLGILLDFHRMLVFDAVICNIDRHDENWEVFERRRLTPIFDNGRIELAFLTPKKQLGLLGDAESRHKLYMESRPALRWEPEVGDFYDPHQFGFLEVLRQEHPDEFAMAVEPFLRVSAEAMDHCVDELPDGFIPPPCRRLAKVMLRERMEQLEALV